MKLCELYVIPQIYVCYTVGPKALPGLLVKRKEEREKGKKGKKEGREGGKISVPFLLVVN